VRDPATLIIGNWKMNGLKADGQSLAREVAGAARRLDNERRQLVVCPPFTLLHPVAKVLAGTPVVLGAQDCHAQESGAFTGSISATMLADAGCRYVLVGHSERRSAGETSHQVHAKVRAAWRYNLIPVVCIGETAEQRSAGATLAVLDQQLRESIPTGSETFVLAYEPVWAIGTGKVATADDIASAHGFVRERLLRTRSGAEQPLILYGGSVTESNAAGILAMEHVAGVLVGGASLRAETFIRIASAAG
jgi:triosephosphate isomerase